MLFGRKEGLYDDTVFQILEDSAGQFLTGSNRNISCVSKDDLNQLAQGKIQNVTFKSYGIGDGMRTNECNGGSQPSGLKDRLNRL